eukprot:TRINITY_DN2361_c0_g1_i1.p6 TRINITY_DN2361_c0_g1~~TRINITY_DN2361_c0_g1_i1.p6  ORF type:complete len:104 (-),score=2.92 TRINITY_DN2361_c0_g1_i1:579-890(-)
MDDAYVTNQLQYFIIQMDYFVNEIKQQDNQQQVQWRTKTVIFKLRKWFRIKYFVDFFALQFLSKLVKVTSVQLDQNLCVPFQGKKNMQFIKWGQNESGGFLPF